MSDKQLVMSTILYKESLQIEGFYFFYMRKAGLCHSDMFPYNRYTFRYPYNIRWDLSDQSVHLRHLNMDLQVEFCMDNQLVRYHIFRDHRP